MQKELPLKMLFSDFVIISFEMVRDTTVVPTNSRHDGRVHYR